MSREQLAARQEQFERMVDALLADQKETILKTKSITNLDSLLEHFSVTYNDKFDLSKPKLQFEINQIVVSLQGVVDGSAIVKTMGMINPEEENINKMVIDKIAKLRAANIQQQAPAPVAAATSSARAPTPVASTVSSPAVSNSPKGKMTLELAIARIFEAEKLKETHPEIKDAATFMKYIGGLNTKAYFANIREDVQFIRLQHDNSKSSYKDPAVFNKSVNDVIQQQLSTPTVAAESRSTISATEIPVKALLVSTTENIQKMTVDRICAKISSSTEAASVKVSRLHDLYNEVQESEKLRPKTTTLFGKPAREHTDSYKEALDQVQKSVVKILERGTGDTLTPDLVAKATEILNTYKTNGIHIGKPDYAEHPDLKKHQERFKGQEPTK